MLIIATESETYPSFLYCLVKQCGFLRVRRLLSFICVFKELKLVGETSNDTKPCKRTTTYWNVFWNKGKLLIVVAWQDNAKLVLISCLSEVQDINVIWKKKYYFNDLRGRHEYWRRIKLTTRAQHEQPYGRKIAISL